MNKTFQFLTKPFRRQVEHAAAATEVEPHSQLDVPAPDFEWEPDEALSDYFRTNPSVTLLEKLQIDSPALERLIAAGIKLVVPLVSQGELIGMLNLGQRLSEQDYSSDDIALLNNLAAQATPAVRVAQLVREQQEEAKERERMEQELQVARLIQQTLLPKELPQPEGWSVQAYYQPARAVGGDFYDFVQLPNNRLGIFVGDVTDKGVPAALVMATTRRILRFAALAKPDGDAPGAAAGFASPGWVLEQANDLLCPDIPPNMFVTCLYAVLELDSGKLVYANAGHNPPYCYGSQRTEELRARGMPLGLMPVMKYEELETVLAAGERLLLYSDGITEAHNQGREMFGFDRIKALVDVSPLENPTQLAQGGEDSQFIRILLDELSAFTGAGWEQEDDVTVVILNRQPHPQAVVDSAARQDPAPEINTTSVNPISAEIHTGREVRMDSHGESALTKSNPGPDTHLAHFQVQSQPGNERQAMRQVVEAVESLGLDLRTLERLKTAVAEATMNAMEHGNQFQADLLVDIDVRTSGERLSVTIRDYGGSQPIPDAGKPDLDAKLAGEQSPRGWGLFLIEKMVDEMNVSSDESRHTVELVIYIQRAQS